MTNLARVTEALAGSYAVSYFLHEEEAARAGARVSQAFQRARWYGGRVVTWLGAEKQTGRGEGSGNLRFDYLAPARGGSSTAFVAPRCRGGACRHLDCGVMRNDVWRMAPPPSSEPSAIGSRLP